MTQAGHKTANLTLSMYAQEMDREDGESERLAALVNGGGGEWRAIGTRQHVSVEPGARDAPRPRRLGLSPE